MHTDVTTIRYEGLLYRLPFAHLFRPHTPLERERLVASIRQEGVLDRIVTYDSPTHGKRCVIDGATRLELAIELKLAAIPVQHKGALDDETAERLAIAYNTARRHLTPAEQQEQRQARIARVAAARSAGESLRAIAQREEVSHEQVRRDLEEAAGVTPVTPGRVTGTDGKSYPAAPVAPVAPVAPAEPVGRPAPTAPDPLRGLAQARSALTRLRSALDELAAGPLLARLCTTLTRHDFAPGHLAALDAALSDLDAQLSAERFARPEPAGESGRRDGTASAVEVPTGAA